MRIIAHLDMDAFFAAVEERDNPQFKGLPIVVGADPKEGKGRGVVSTANYLARGYGIKSATPISTAWRMSQGAQDKGNPPAVFLPVNMSRYAEISQKIMKIISRYTPLVEQVSVDEAYLDMGVNHEIHQAEDHWIKAAEIAQKLKEEIKQQEDLTASIGIGPNKLVAKLASDMQKPDGLTVIKEDEVLPKLGALPIRAIPGVGPKTEEKLGEMGVLTVLDLRVLKKEELAEKFGKWGEDIWEKAWGRDESPVAEDPTPAKSIGEQETFQTDTLDSSLIFTLLEELTGRVWERFQESEFKSFKTVTVTVRFEDFETKTRAHTGKKIYKTKSEIKQEAMKLILPFLDARENPKNKSIRLLGVRVEKLD